MKVEVCWSTWRGLSLSGARTNTNGSLTLLMFQVCLLFNFTLRNTNIYTIALYLFLIYSLILFPDIHLYFCPLSPMSFIYAHYYKILLHCKKYHYLLLGIPTASRERELLTPRFNIGPGHQATPLPLQLYLTYSGGGIERPRA